MVDRKTPGVYVVEENAFPNSVVGIATAVPAFIGCTQIAARGNQSLNNIPTRISSFSEYVTLFGGPPDTKFAYGSAVAPATGFNITIDPTTHYYFYASILLFFENGGGPCYIISIGQFDQITIAGGMVAVSNTVLCDAPLALLLKEQEPTILVVPDAVLLGLPGWQYTCQQMQLHCVKMQSRISIFDVYDGYKARDYDATNDVISGTNGFRGQINADDDGLKYGVAYYPWLNTTVTPDDLVDYGFISDTTKALFAAALTAEAVINFPASANGPDPKLAQLLILIAKITAHSTLTDSIQAKLERAPTHQALSIASPLYQSVMKEIQRQLNIVPPSAAMAGVYTQVDNEYGVFKAPANVTINSATAPTVNITDADQEDLNVPLDGKAINAIRTFPARGLVVWGARTLDGNSQDWRYISVRRTMIMLEQSIKIALQAYVFAPNNASTWVTVKSLIINFLSDFWKQGGLAGAKPEDAFSVAVGLGSTMTGEDILNGYMRLSVLVAVVRPAEFIVLTFQQQMQTS